MNIEKALQFLEDLLVGAGTLLWALVLISPVLFFVWIWLFHPLSKMS